MKLLIIDDNAGVRTSLKILLSRHFDRVLAVGDPTLIPALLAEGDVDAVLLDMNFGADRFDGADGLFWLRNIKAMENAPAVVLITAFGELPLAVDAMKSGADDFVTKPWDNDRLLLTISNAIERNRREKARSRAADEATELRQSIERQRAMTLGEITTEHIRATVESCGGNLSLAAERLGISRQTLYNRLRNQ